MEISKQEIQAIYQRRAKHYDFAVMLYRLIGFRYDAYRSRAVKRLYLQRGDCVVELGCGTGLNFPLILEQIGPEVRLIGVDLTPGMLECARKRVEACDWKNIELVQLDMAAYEFPKGVNAILSTGAFGFVAEHDQLIKAASHALVPGGRLVIWDIKRPERWPSWLFTLVMWLARPFGVTREYVDSRPWETVKRYFEETAFEQMYAGAAYISSGTAPSRAILEPGVRG